MRLEWGKNGCKGHTCTLHSKSTLHSTHTHTHINRSPQHSIWHYLQRTGPESTIFPDPHTTPRHTIMQSLWRLYPKPTQTQPKPNSTWHSRMLFHDAIVRPSIQNRGRRQGCRLIWKKHNSAHILAVQVQRWLCPHKRRTSNDHHHRIAVARLGIDRKTAADMAQ